MAIEKVININVNSGQARQDFSDLNAEIEEQRQILLLLEEEYFKAKRALDAYNDANKINLAQEAALKNTLKERKAALEDQRLGLKKLAVRQREANQAQKEQRIQTRLTNDVVRGIDKLTGGFATKVVKLTKGFISGAKKLKVLVVGLKGLRTAVLATGIGALAIGIGLVAANFDKIKAKFKGLTEEGRKAAEELKKEQEALRASIAKQTAELRLVSRAYEMGTLKGDKLKRAVRDLAKQYGEGNIELDENNRLTKDSIKFIDDQIKAIKIQAQNKARLTKIEELYTKEIGQQAIAQGAINNVNNKQAEIDRLRIKLAAEENLFQREKLVKIIGVRESELKKLQDRVKVTQGDVDRTNKQIDAQIKKLVKADIQTPAEESKDRKKEEKEAEKLAAERRSRAEKELARQEAENQLKIDQEERLQAKIAEIKNKVRDAEANTEEEKRALEIQKIKEQNQRLLAEAFIFGQATEELRLSLDQKLQAKLDQFAEEDREKKQKKNFEELELSKEFEQLAFEDQRNILQERREILLQDELVSDEQRISLQKQFTEASNKIDLLEFDAKQKVLDDTEAALEGLGAVAGEQTAVGKGLAIASSTINTFRGVSDALAAQTVTPFETALKFANAAAILSSGLQNVKKIAAVQVPTKSSGSAPTTSTSIGGGGAISQPPSFNIVGATETSQLAEAIGEQTQQPVQAFVVANDVTTAQSLENNIVEGATL